MRELAVITGGGRGIGRAIALAFAKEKIDLFLIARSASELDETAAEAQALGANVQYCVTDITNPDDRNQLTSRLREMDVSILVNNAGVAPSMKVEDTSAETWAQTISLNLSAPFFLAQAVIPQMKKHSRGRIVNIASTAALEGYAYTAAYTASKHGLLGLTRALAVELERYKIQVNAICPGFVRTRIVETGIQNLVSRTGRTAQESEQQFAKLNKEGRLIEPEEVAAVALQLVSAGNQSTGKAFDSDGRAID